MAARTPPARTPPARIRPARSTPARPAPVVADEYLLHEAADTFALLASATRLHLLYLLSLGEQDVSSLAEAVGGTVPMVSQHLAKLRLADLVSSRRDGKRQVYVLDDPHVVALVHQALDHHDQLRRPAGTRGRRS